MEEETKQEPIPEPTFMDKIIKEKEEIQKIRDEAKKLVDEFKELKAQELLAGTANAGNSVKQPEEESPLDYSKRLLAGKIEDAP